MAGEAEETRRRLAQAEQVILLAQQTRSAQRAYFATRYQSALRHAKELEAKLDQALDRWFWGGERGQSEKGGGE